MRKTTLTLLTLFALLSGYSGSAQTTYYQTDGTTVATTTGLESGYYLLSVWSIGHEGLLYWSDAGEGTNFGLDANTQIAAKTNVPISSAADSEDLKYLFYINMVAENVFTLQSVKSSRYASLEGPAGVNNQHVNVKDVAADDANIARYTLVFSHGTTPNAAVTIPAGSGVPHFIVKLNNSTFNSNTPAYLHTQSPTGGIQHLTYYGGYNTTSTTGATVSCDKIAFYKLTATEVATLTYNYRMNGTTVLTENRQAIVGAAFPDLTLPAYCTCATSKPAGNVASTDEGSNYDFDITWNGPFQFTASTDNAVWYHVRAAAAQAVLRNPGGAAAIPLKNEGLSTAENTFTYSTNDQWAFVGDPYNGFQFYNRTQNSSNAYGRLVSSTTMSGETGKGTQPVVSFDALPEGYTELWDVTPSTAIANANGFFMGEHGLPNNRMNSRDNYLAFWTGGASAGSTFTVTKSMQELPLHAFGENSYATFYTNYPVTLSSGDVTAYIGTLNAERNTLDMTAITDNIIPANTGVVLEGNSNTVTTANLTIADAAGDFASNQGSLTGTLIDLDIDGFQSAVLVLGPSTDKVPTLGFYQPTAITIPAYRAYINLNTLGVRGFALHFDKEVTGLHPNIGTTHPSDNAAIYDLSGRRVQKATHGVYIRDGKKYIVK